MIFGSSKKNKDKSEERFVDENRKKQHRARRRKAMMPFYIVLFVFIFAGFVYLCLTMLFNVDRIIVEGNTLYDVNEIIKTTGIEKGDNLFQVDTQYAEDKLFSVYNYIEEVSVKRKFPNAVSVEIVEAEPFAVLEEADGYTLISAKGKVLERGIDEKPRDKILVRGINTISSTSEDTERLEVLGEIMKEMQSRNMKNYDFVDISDILDIIIIAEDRIKINLGNELEIPYKLQFVNEVVSNKLEKTGYFYVDASKAGEIMTKEMTVSPWYTLETAVGGGFADEDEE